MSNSKIAQTQYEIIFVALDRGLPLRAFRKREDAEKFAAEYADDLEYKIDVQWVRFN